jgi:hypothetical protein
MLLFAAAVLVAPAVPNAPVHRAVAPLVQAQATVRILLGARVQLGQQSTIEGQRLRRTTVSTPQGVRPASLVEFE